MRRGYSIPATRRLRPWRLMWLLPLGLVVVFAASRHRAMRASHARIAAQSVHQQLSFDAIDALPAYVYPSQRTAALAAARRAADAIPSVNANPQMIWVDASAEEDARIVAAAAQQAFPKARCVIGTPEAGADRGQIVLLHAVRTQKQDAGVGREEHRGQIEIRVVGGRGAMSVSAQYDERPWLDDFAGYANAHAGRGWLVARGREVCLSPAEARAAAEADAAMQVANLVKQQMPRRRTGNSPRPNLLSAARRAVNGGGLVADRFLQRFHRPYGDIWSESILLDVSADRLAPMEYQMLATSRNARISSGRTVGAVMLMLLFIGLTYVFLNLITRSYFTARLRAGAIAAMALVLAVAIIYLTRRMQAPL